MARLRWEDIAGAGGGPAAPAAAGNAEISIPGAGAPQGDGISLTGLTAQLKDGLDLIKMIDQYVGLFKGLAPQKRSTAPPAGQIIEGQVLPQGLPGEAQLPAAQVFLKEAAPQAAPAADPPQAPAAAAQPQLQATPDQVTALLEKVIKGEGDIPLSKFLQGIKGPEPWIIKYALELVAGT